MVHVEGTRSLQCGIPVEKMSGAFIDMAVGNGAPIVPIRFVGGLPTQPLDERIEFPVEMGKQDIWIGRPILPTELEDLPYGERKSMVLSSLNELGPRHELERPIDGDEDFAQSVQEWQSVAGVSHEHATLFRVLQSVEDPCLQTKALLDAVSAGGLDVGEGKEAEWLRELAGWLLGGRMHG